MPCASSGQTLVKSQAELDKAIASLDAALFDSYDRCDLEKFGSFFFDDVEFYHEQGGVTLGKVKLTDSIKKNICGKVTRELVPGTLQVQHTHSHRAIEREHNAQDNEPQQIIFDLPRPRREPVDPEEKPS